MERRLRSGALLHTSAFKRGGQKRPGLVHTEIKSAGVWTTIARKPAGGSVDAP